MKTKMSTKSPITLYSKDNINEMKLYVWEDVLQNYTSGMICILAHNLEEAKKLLLEKYPAYYAEDFGKPHKVITEPEAFAVYGGG